MGNEIYLSETNEIDFIRIPLATAAAAAAASLLAKASPELANIVGVIAFVTVFLAPVTGKKAPAQSLLEIATRWKVV